MVLSPVRAGGKTGHCKLAAVTPEIYYATDGIPFPATVLDDGGTDGAGLPAEIAAQVLACAESGKDAFEDEDWAGAYAAFRDGLALLPAPRERWNAAGWLLVAMGEASYRAGDFAAAFPPFRDAVRCPGGLGNPFLHLRLGQCRYELDDPRALDELARAFMGGGFGIFVDEDPVYWEVVEAHLELPPRARDNPALVELATIAAEAHAVGTWGLVRANPARYLARIDDDLVQRDAFVVQRDATGRAVGVAYLFRVQPFHGWQVRTGWLADVERADLLPALVARCAAERLSVRHVVLAESKAPPTAAQLTAAGFRRTHGDADVTVWDYP
jgi:hypothetical protein